MKHVLSIIYLISFLIISIPTTKVHAAEKDMYDFSWLDKDKEVYVLQNRKFRKKNSVYFGGTIGRSISGAFIDSNEGNIMAGYFFSEDWGLEFTYTKANGTTNKIHDAVNAQVGGVAFFKKIDTAMTAMLMWSPFYSKINTFNKIFYYDWLFGLGVSNISTLDNRNEFAGGSDSNELTSESESAVAWVTGFRFYINQNWSSRIDLRGTHANTEMTIDTGETEKRWNNYYNFNIGLNYAF
jgi:outer membrane beta-barrel protein